MILSEKLKSIPFFADRVVTETSDNGGIAIIGFKEDENDIYSALIVSPQSTSGVIPDVLMISTKGCIIRLDEGQKTIMIAIGQSGEKNGFTVELPSTVDDGEFFQSSLINDYRHINYDYISALQESLEILNDTRTESC